MKKLFFIPLIALLSIFFCMASYATATEEKLDNIVALVNDDVITKSELNHALSMMKMEFSRNHLPSSANDLPNQVLDQLINRKLQLLFASQMGLKTTDNELDNAIERVAKLNNVPVATLYKRINQMGMSITDYRQEMRDQLTMQKLQQQEVLSRITLSKQEVDSFLSSKMWQNNGAKEYKIDDILIPLSEEPSTTEITAAKKRAQGIITKLKAGQSIREIQQAESSDKGALQHTNLGWRSLAEMPSAFAEQVAHMQKKEVAGPIKTANGLHIIHLAAERADKQAPPDKKQIEELLLQRKFEEAVQTWMSKLRTQSFVKKLEV